MRDAWRLAFGTFTVIPVALPGRVDRGVAGTAMLLAPLTALPSAGAWVVLGLLAAQGVLPPGVAAVLAVVVTTLVSRALHLDGLADTTDGLSAGYDRERALAVMRRGDTGPSGAVALVLVIVVDVTCLAGLFTSATGVALGVSALVASRLAPALACRTPVPAARADGLGATVAGSVSVPRLLVVSAAVAAATGLAITAVAAVTGLLVAPRLEGVLVVVAAALIAAFVVTRVAVRRLGGITGDVIGAAVELSLATALVVASTANRIVSLA